MLDGKDRTADAVAMTECDLLAIDRRDFVPFVRANPEIALRLIAVLCGRLRNTTEQFEDVVFLDAPSRLAKRLLHLAGALDPQAKPGAPPVLTISQRDLGNMLGLSRESINKHLAAWQQGGMIKLDQGTITLLDMRALRHHAETA